MKLKILIIAIISMFCSQTFSQANIRYIRTIDSTFYILDQGYPDDTLFKFTKNGFILKYESNSPTDTLATKSDISGIVSDTSQFSFKSDSSNHSSSSLYSDTSSFAINATKDSIAGTYTATDTLKTPLIAAPLNLDIESEDIGGGGILNINDFNEIYINAGDDFELNAIGSIESNSASNRIIASTQVKIESNVQITTLDDTEFDFAGDSLSSLEGRSRFKTFIAGIGGFVGNLFGNKAVVDSLIVNGDTITGKFSAKTYIESESFDNINTDTITGDSLIVTGKLSSEYYIGQVFTADGSVTVSVAVADTYYTISGYETTGTGVISENLTIATSSITIPSDGHGYYDVYIGNSSTHSVNNSSVHASLFVNGVEYEPNEAERKIGTGGDFGDAGRSSIVLLNGGDVLTARIKSDNTGTVTINHGTFYVARRN